MVIDDDSSPSDVTPTDYSPTDATPVEIDPPLDPDEECDGGPSCRCDDWEIEDGWDDDDNDSY